MEFDQPLASAKGVRMQFGGNEVLHGVSLDLLPGEVHAITGENGAGKSTLARILAGIYRPSGGSVEVNGKPVTFRSATDAMAAGVALVHQEPMTFDHLTIAENIFVGAQPRKFGLVDWGKMNHDSADILSKLGQSFDPTTAVGNLTLAGKQMVEVACALAQGAKVIILDETTAALSPGEVEELFTVVRQLRDEGRAIGIVSHRLGEVFSLCDRVTVLRDGAKVGEVKPSVSDVNDVVRMMVGRDLETVTSASREPGETVLVVQGLTLPGATDITFQVKKSEIVALAGLVGSGRTEIAHGLFGITPLETGQIHLDGSSITPKNPRHAVQLGMALVPEDRLKHGIISQMSLAQNVSLPILGRLGKVFARTKKEEALTKEWIARLGVVCRTPDQAIGELSGGNQQKLVLGKWLETKPKLLIVDEPTRGVDVGAKAAVHQLMRELADSGLAIIAISSDLPEVLTIADRILVMHEGRVVREFKRGEATEESIMTAATGQGANAA